MIAAMKITAIETFVVNSGFKPPRPWHFCASRTDEGLTGYSEFGGRDSRVLVGLVQDLGARQYRPFLERHALGTIMVDVCWQGSSASKKVADLAETHEFSVAPHNYNGHLSSFQALNFVASVSNVKIMESDLDATPLRDELFTVLPDIKDDQMAIPTRPGWGTELNEKAARTHAWEG